MANDPWVIAATVVEAGPSPEVVIEATSGWYWIVDWLQQPGATLYLANPSGLNWGTRRVKNDGRMPVSRHTRPARPAITRSTGISRKGARSWLTTSVAELPAKSSAREMTE